MFLNKIIVIGNLTRDPELKSLPSGVKVATFSLATNRVWMDKDSGKKEEVTYHNVVAFGKQAETIAQYVKKGGMLMVEGRSQTRSWDDKTSGKKLYKTEIVLENFQFGPKSSGSASSERKVEKEDDLDIEFPEDEINPEDIPF